MKASGTDSICTIVALALLLAGCAGPSGNRDPAAVDIVASNDRFALARLRQGQDYGDLAQAVLGSRDAAWQLREINAVDMPPAGTLVAIPLRPTRPLSIYPEHYRTLPILCYHRFTTAERAGQRLELTAAAFEEQLRYLRQHNYRILGLDEVATILAGDAPIPPRAVVLTIDDGYRSVYEVAWPLLRKYRAPATLFIYNDFIGGGSALNWDQLREMQASGLVVLGSHGKSHASLAPLPGEASDSAGYRRRVRAELEGAADGLGRQLGSRPRFLSYPYGNSTPAVADWARDAGYEIATTVTRGDNPAYANPLILHRTMIYSDHDMGDFARFVEGSREEPVQ